MNTTVKIIRRNINKIQPDIIHLHSTFAGFIVRTHYIFKSRKPKIIYCSHGWSFLMDIGFIKKYIYLSIEKILCAYTDLIINISDSLITALIQALCMYAEQI